MKIKNKKKGGNNKAILTFTVTILTSLNINIAEAKYPLSDKTSMSDINSMPEQEKNSKTKFSTRFLANFNNSVDLSYFEQENSNPPGNYRVDIVVNQQRLHTFQVRFIKQKEKVVPCFPVAALQQLPIDKKQLPIDWTALGCIQLAELFPGAVVDYNYDDEALYVTVPQVYLIDRPEGFIDPERWDEGINAFSMNYNFSASDLHYRQANNLRPHQYSLYGSLGSTLRLGNWRFHSYDAWRSGTQNNEGFQHQLGYAERAIGSLLSELSIGDISTSGDFFENTSLQGVMLRSDDRMYPWTVKGYAPMISGVAKSNAVVTVKQNGNILLEKNVPPGEFKISNLAALGYGGNLDVTIMESNGESQHFTVPYSSLPQLIREGYYRYSLAAGRIRYYGRDERPMLLESTLAYGLNNTVTLYGGLQAVPEKRYTAIDSGIAMNTWLGAFSIALAESLFNDDADSRKHNSISSNARLKMGFAKRLTATNTAINLVTYAFSGKNYYTLNQALQAGYQRYGRNRDDMAERSHNRIEATISQALTPGWGEIDFSGWWENYHGGSNQKQYGSSYFLGYRNSYEKINYSFSANRVFSANNKANTLFYLNFSMPFGSTDRKRPNFNTTISYSSEEAKLRTGISGNHTGEESITNFNAYFRQSSKTLSNFDINLGHTGSVLQKGISYSQGVDYFSGAVSLNGGVVAHPNGINFSPWLSDTIALIEAPGAEGARLTANRLARVNSRGYALLSSVTPYEENLMTLDLKGTAASFDIDENGKIVVPTAGALVKVTFPEHVNKSLLGRFKQEDGHYLPFGTYIYDADNNVAGIVGQGGIAMLSLPPEKGALEARWKKDDRENSCEIKPEKIIKQQVKNNQEQVITCYASHREVES